VGRPLRMGWLRAGRRGMIVNNRCAIASSFLAMPEVHLMHSFPSAPDAMRHALRGNADEKVVAPAPGNPQFTCVLALAPNVLPLRRARRAVGQIAGSPSTRHARLACAPCRHRVVDRNRWRQTRPDDVGDGRPHGMGRHPYRCADRRRVQWTLRPPGGGGAHRSLRRRRCARVSV